VTHENKINANFGAICPSSRTTPSAGEHVSHLGDYRRILPNRRLNLRPEDSRKKVKLVKLIKQEEESALGGINH
jgi:hypothetical protein